MNGKLRTRMTIGHQESYRIPRQISVDDAASAESLIAPRQWPRYSYSNDKLIVDIIKHSPSS